MNLFAVAGDDQEIHIFVGYEKKLSLKGHNREIYDVVFLSDSLLASASGDGTIKIWNFQTGECLKELIEHNDEVYSLCFQPPYTLLSASEDKTVRIWNILDWSSKTIEFTKGIRQIKCESDKTYVLDQANSIYSIDISSLEAKKIIKSDNEIYSFTFMENRFFLGAEEDILIYEGDKKIKNLKKHTSAIHNLFLVSFGKLISSSFDKIVIIWDLDTFEDIYTIEHDDDVETVEILDSKTIVSIDSKGNLYFWSYQGSLIEKIALYHQKTYVIRFSPFQNLLNFQNIHFKRDYNIFFHF